MSYSSEVNRARTNPNPIILDVRDSSIAALSPRKASAADEPLYRVEPAAAGRMFAENALKRGPTTKAGGENEATTPPKSYQSLHTRRHSVEAGMSVEGVKHGGALKQL